MRGKKRPQRERIAAVALAEVDGIEAASVTTGIPRSTIQVWMDRPEFGELRQKTREELAEGFKLLAHLAMTRLVEQVEAGNVEPRDLTILLGVATDKHLLTSGQATSRSETRDTTHDLDPDTRRRITDWIDRQLDTDSRPVDGVSKGEGAEVR